MRSHAPTTAPAATVAATSPRLEKAAAAVPKVAERDKEKSFLDVDWIVEELVSAHLHGAGEGGGQNDGVGGRGKAAGSGGAQKPREGRRGSEGRIVNNNVSKTTRRKKTRVRERHTEKNTSPICLLMLEALPVPLQPGKHHCRSVAKNVTREGENERETTTLSLFLR